VNDRERSDLFGRARLEASPREEERRRVRAALTRKLGALAAASVGVAATKAAAGATEVGLSALAVVKAAAVVVAITAVGFVAFPARRGASPSSRPTSESSIARAAPAAREQEAAPVASTSSAPTEASRPETLPPREAAPGRPAPAPLSTTPKPRVSPPTPEPAVVARDDAQEEVELVRQMQIALRDGDAARVLALVSEDERRFPSSPWVPERDGARTLALCGGAPPSEARAMGRAFLDGHPLSPLAARVQSACGLRAPLR
jgi:hypothetical protein